MELPSFFGEVLPVLSRAVDDSDDDEAPILRDLELSWTNNDKQNRDLKCRILLLAHGPVAATFVNAYYLSMEKWEKLADVKELPDTKNDEITEMKTLGKLYNEKSNSSGTIICVCDKYIQSEQIWPFVDKVFSTIDCTQSTVLTLTQCPIHEYKCEDKSKLSTPIVRGLCTTHTDTECLFQKLEQPNMVKGIPAAVLSYCEINSINSSLYICFPETIYLDTASVQSFKPLLSLNGMPQHQEVKTAMKQIIKKSIKSSSESNLYL